MRVCLALASAVIAGFVAAGAEASEDSLRRAALRSGAWDGEGHAWLVIGEPAGEKGGGVFSAAVMHAPPRMAGDSMGELLPAMGVARPVAAFAGWGREVAMVLDAEPGTQPEFAPGTWVWPVQRVTAAPFGRTWQYPPGRPEALPNVVMERSDRDVFGFIAGFEASDAGWGLLTAHRARGAEREDGPVEWGDARLMVLRRGGWARECLPWENRAWVRSGTLASVPGPRARVLLTGTRGGFGLGIIESSAVSMTFWNGRFGAVGVSGGAGWGCWIIPRMAWAARTLAIAEGALPEALVLAPDPGATDDPVIGWSWSSAGLRLSRVGADRLEHLLAMADVPRAVQVVTRGDTESGGRVLVVWASPAKDGRKSAGLEMAEVSASTGRVVFRGPVRTGLLTVTRQYQVLAVTVGILMVGVLFYVLRPERSVTRLPKGFATSAGIRRMAAGAVDLLLGCMLAGTVLRQPLEAVVDARSYLSGEIEWTGFLVVIGMTVLHCATGEWLSGQSLGKMMTGCRVINLRPRPDEEGLEKVRLTASQALLRNVIRWMVPVFGLLGLLDMDGRHPADLAAGTAVVVEDPAPDDE